MKYLLLLLMLVSCGLPKDAEDSYARAKATGLKVGYVERPPFCSTISGRPVGNEVALITKFAESKGLKVEFVHGSESELIKKMERFELSLLIGGFRKDTPWAEKVGISTPYNTAGNCILTAPGENRLLFELEGHLFNHINQNGDSKI